MSFAALNIAASSLRAQQKAIDVLSHNMANVNTPGYSRQSPNIVTASPVSIGNLNFGRGVNLNDIQRSVDPLINNAMRENTSQSAYWDTVTSGLTTVESTFGSLDNTGLSAAVNDYFLSWQQLSNNPQDVAQKNNVLNKSETLTTQLNQMYTQLSNAQQSLNQDINQQIDAANLKIDAIASLSNQIKSQEASQQGGSSAANDLRDQRDESIRQLAKIIPIQQVNTKDGNVLIQTAGGDMLTHDGTARHLQRGNSTGSNGFQDIVIQGKNTPIQGLDTGGSLGGMLALRDGNFQGYMDDLNSFAANLAYTTNQVHSSAGGGTPASIVQSGQGSLNPALALNDPSQGVAFSGQVQAGSFNMHVYDATGAPLTPSSDFIINLAVGATMNDVVTAVNASGSGVTASVDIAGRLNLDAGANTVAFSNDTSNFLAAYEVNSFFHGATAGNLSVSQHIQNNARAINTGQIAQGSSLVFSGDNTAAIQIMNLQDQALSVDGSPAASLHGRISSLSSQYGLDVGLATQQSTYRQSEADSLTQQRDAVSGVNVDEELIAMIKFQRAYEASAKVISTSSKMMDSLMGILR
ncbi:MAG: flagellar hook-associated protein FlgK [Ghiorsea sp.]|nr:flagellar hook-associated protein FlgK [Ghiorsea sp.]